MFAIFDQNKNFISYSDEKFDDRFLSREIPQEQSNLLEWRWDGNYDTGKMVKIDSLPYNDPQNPEFFNKKYPLPLFFSLLLKQIYLLAKKQNLLDVSFETMVKDFILCNETEDDYVDLLRLANKLNK